MGSGAGHDRAVGLANGSAAPTSVLAAMTPLDDLPADQRAVIELVLGRGRDYDEIAGLLSIDRADVRERALAALDALGPEAAVPPERRALITDYLLGQLPPRVAEDVHRRLALEPADRAWARVIASELAEVAASPLPEIPAAAPAPGTQGVSVATPAADLGAEARLPGYANGDGKPSGAEPAGPTGPVATGKPPQPSALRGAQVSRTGGAILLGVLAVIVVAVVLIIVLSDSAGKATHSTGAPQTTAAGTGTTATGAASTGTPSTGSLTTPPILGQTHLTATAAGGTAVGAGEIFTQSGANYLAIVATRLAANNANYYGVWLAGGPGGRNLLLGFSPKVTSNGNLATGTKLKAGDEQYKTLELTLEPNLHPKTPGTVVLSGPFSYRP